MFVEHYTYNAWEPTIRSRIFFSIVTGSGTRVTARTRGVAKDTVTDEPVAFHIGTREHENRDKLLALLRPFAINMVYTDHNYAYRSRVTESEVATGKENT
jgi:hypothetical protein